MELIGVENEVPSDLPDTPGETTDTDGEYSSDYSFLAEGAPSSLSEPDNKLVSGLNDFAFDIAGIIASDEGFVFSPISMSILLGMVSSGSAGETRNEICAALNMKRNEQAEVNRFFRDFIAVSKKGIMDGEALDFANIVVADNSFPMLESYKKQVKNYYDALVFNKDFANEDIALFINGWAKKQTRGVIEKVFDQFPDGIDNIILNSLYFNAVWEFPFNPASPSDFKMPDGRTKKVQMMKSMDKPYVRYTETGRFKLVRYPFGSFLAPGSAPKAGDFELDILLPPTNNGADYLIKSLNEKEFSEALDNTTYRYVILSMPKFVASTRVNYNDILPALGINALFSSPDLSNMTTRSYDTVNIEQLAKISFDESGAEAAAISYEFPAGNYYENDPDAPVYFTCNRPFIYIIRQNSTGAILFLGSYK
ncbi:MAG: serpin family protein [Bacteroidales bacterium]|nr:serpin family protein [Bacteroidales bacterium]